MEWFRMEEAPCAQSLEQPECGEEEVGSGGGDNGLVTMHRHGLGFLRKM